MNAFETLSCDTIEQYQSDIINWYRSKGRNFPWRKTEDPFEVLVAELILKLTGAWKGENAYNRFIEKYGSPALLAEADLNEMREIFKPLGLTSRADTLVNMARQILAEFQGRVPITYDELLKLRGVGQYIANAVLCLACNECVPLVDGSILRVFKRCLSFTSNRQAYADKQVWVLATNILPKRYWRDYNLGLLDVGALICTHSKPKCDECPIGWLCQKKSKMELNIGGESELDWK